MAEEEQRLDVGCSDRAQFTPRVLARSARSADTRPGMPEGHSQSEDCLSESEYRAADRGGTRSCICKAPSTWTQYKTLLAKDLKAEFRTKDMIVSMGIYAFLVIVVFGVALSFARPGSEFLEVSGGLLWALVVFTSLLGLNRSFSKETENGCLEGLLLAPLDRGVIFLAKATSNLVFLALVEVIAVPLYWVFFSSFAAPGRYGLAARGAASRRQHRHRRHRHHALHHHGGHPRQGRHTGASVRARDLPASVRLRVGHHLRARGRRCVRRRVSYVAGPWRWLRCDHDSRQLGVI